MICNIDAQPTAPLNEAIHAFLSPLLPHNVCEAYGGYLASEERLNTALTAYFATPEEHAAITPIIIFNELTQEIVTLFSSASRLPDETGEPGSILAHVRASGYGDEFMCSDCYGQLSCSSCAIEVLTGTLENPIPREEEYDMLDIDETKPPTEKTRLGCQAIVGTEPLVVKIRAPEKTLISTI